MGDLTTTHDGKWDGLQQVVVLVAGVDVAGAAVGAGDRRRTDAPVADAGRRAAARGRGQRRVDHLQPGHPLRQPHGLPAGAARGRRPPALGPPRPRPLGRPR